MDCRTITVNGKEYQFLCRSARNRSGFTHDCELKVGGRIYTCHAQYYNRTWEPYTYYSVMNGALYDLRGSVESKAKEKFMSERGYGRLTATRKAEFEQELAKNEVIKELDEVKSQLSHGTWW